MKEFEPTEEGYITRLIEENTAQPELGRITKVFEHSDENDNSNFEANVKLRDADKERRRIPIATNPFNGAVAVPEVDDTVLVDFLDGRGESPVIVGVIHNDRDRAPVGQSGVYRLRKGGLYFEMHPNGDWARISKKSSDDGSPESKIEMRADGTVNLTGYERCSTEDGVTASGDGTVGPFTLSHSLGTVPSSVDVQPRSADASEYNFWVSDKTSDYVEVTYHTAPNSGTDNLEFDVTVYE